MIDRGIDFPYVHDLAHLVSLLEDAGEPVPRTVRRAEALTQFAWATRYPSTHSPVSANEHSEAVELAEAVVNWATEHLKL